MNLKSIGSDGKPLGEPVLAALLDEKSGLMWAAQDVSDRPMTYAEAMKSPIGCTCAGFDDWRLPSIGELETLRDRALFNPAADPALGLKSEFYWSSTAAPKASSFSDFAWLVYFLHGVSTLDSQYNRAFVRLVRRARASQ